MADTVSLGVFNFGTVSPGNTSGTAGQYHVELFSVSGADAPNPSTQIKFRFTNSAVAGNSWVTSSITDVYFDDADPGLLGTGPNPLIGSAGVNFSKDAHPPDLPSPTSYHFVATASADSNEPNVPLNGIQQNEWLDAYFTGNGTAVQAAISSGALRIGIHVQTLAAPIGSESFIAPPPDGGAGGPIPGAPLPSAALGGISLLGGLGTLGRRGRKTDPA